MYSFEPTEEQKMVVNAAKKLALKEFRSRMHDADESGTPVPEWMQAGWELSLLPASIPEQFGGFRRTLGADMGSGSEELAWGDLSATLSLAAPNLIALQCCFAEPRSRSKSCCRSSAPNRMCAVRRPSWNRVRL